MPLVLWLREGTGHHAVTAANALPNVVNYGTVGGLMKRPDRTNRGAGRMFAMHAKPAHEFVLFGKDDGIFMFRLHRFGSYFIAIGQLVLFRTSHLALLTAYAYGRVIQQSLAH
jgi:hypothetical protein